ncbi:MAG: hypothetical protein Q8914_06660 [Bacteroidota bacterium]|nr:hypothetical protein [Bacteroidota bacterium]
MKSFLLTTMFLAPVALLAGNADSLLINVSTWNAPWRSYADYFNYNPSATFEVPVNDYLELGTSYSASKADKGFHLAQDGDGYSAFQLHTESFSRKGKQSFFGEAKYISDQTTNVQWRDVEDGSLLSPYLIADSIGGTYNREAYTMGGGTSIRLRNWEYGIRATYEGGVSYRRVDPRPSNTVSRISVNPGITYRKGNNEYGWFGSYERYRQNVDIDVERDGRKIYFYLLQGFGTYNKQFSELEETYTRIYKGNLYSTGIHLNHQANGRSTGALVTLKKAVFEASESDRRRPYTITHNEIGTSLSHEQACLGQTLFLKGQYAFHQTIGNETQYMPVSINTNYIVWKFATQSDRYQSRNQVAGFSAMLANKDCSTFSVWEQLEGNWQDNRQYYYTPDYHQYLQDVCGSGSVGFHCPMNSTTLEGSIRGGYRKVLSSSLVQDENNVITERVVLPDFAFMTTDYAFYQVNLGICFRLSRKLLGNFSVGGGLKAATEQQAYFGQTAFALNF